MTHPLTTPAGTKDRMKAEMEKPKIGAIAPWFGGKRNLAPEIVEVLGPHTAYWEPFCGSMAVLMAKPKSSSETVNDLHGELINLARTLKVKQTAEDLYDRLMRFVMHEDLFHEAADRWKSRGNQPATEEPDIERAVEFLVCAWFGRNGVCGTQSYNQGFCIRYTHQGGHAATRWRSVVDSIPAWHHRLRGVTILNRDAFMLLEKIADARRGVIYVDSPYVKKGAQYVHDFKPDDHAHLASLLRRFTETRVVVSYYDDPLIRELYRDWTWKSIETTKSLVNAGNRDKANSVKAPEVLLINEKPAGQHSLFD